MEGAELDGHTGADADEGGQRTLERVSRGDERRLTFLYFENKEMYLVERQGAFIFEDLGRTVESAGVSRRRLKANFNDIWQS